MPANLSPSSPPASGYLVIAALLGLAAFAVLAILAATHLPVKWKRHGPVKDAPYESGMEALGDTRRRFNISFYLMAMLFLLFDVELVFMYPWAVVFHRQAVGNADAVAALAGASPSFLLAEMAVFVVILLVGYYYAWKKRVFIIN